MKQNRIQEELAVFFSAALLTSQIKLSEHGFRQRDFKFFLELYLNWAENLFQSNVQRVQNVQIARYLEVYLRRGLLEKRSYQNQPHYHLNRAGLLEVVKSLAEQNSYNDYNQLLFALYIIRTYPKEIEDSIREQGVDFPEAIRLELSALLDFKRIASRHLQKVNLQIDKLKAKIKVSLSSYELVETLTQNQRSEEEIIKTVEKEYPYDLNSTKPLSKLMTELPTNVRLKELQINGIIRAEMIWKNQLKILERLAGGIEEMLASN